MNFEQGDTVRVSGYRGIAFRYLGPETRPDEDTEWSGFEPETGMALVVMVGDDRRHVVDPADMTPLADDEFCGGCGQIGCSHV